MIQYGGPPFFNWLAGLNAHQNTTQIRHAGKSVSVHYMITVPDKAQSGIRSASGNIMVSDAGGKALAHTVSGRVILNNLPDRVTAESVSGDVEGHLQHGDAEIRSVEGI